MIERGCYPKRIFLWASLSSKKKSDNLRGEDTLEHIFILLVKTAIKMVQLHLRARRLKINNFMKAPF